MTNSRIISLVVLIALVLALALLFIEVMIGFLLPLFFALLLTVLFHPLYLRLLRVCGGRTRLAAGIMTIAITLIVLAPVALVIFRAATDAVQFFQNVGSPKLDSAHFDRLIKQVNDRFDLSLSTQDVLKTMADKAQEWFGPVAARTPGFLGGFFVNCFVMVFALFYFLADGEDLVAAGAKLVPLDAKYQRQLLAKFVEISRAVTSATLASALLQSVLLAIGYHFAEFGTAVLLMMLTFFAAFVPVVGSAIVWVPASLWLLFAGHLPAAILLAGYSLAVVVLVDNVMKPLMLHGQANLHPLLGFLSVLGGVAALGPLGIFVGPMAVAFLQTGLRMLNVELDTLRNGAPVGAEVVRAGPAPG